jgi:hypothetical protein
VPDELNSAANAPLRNLNRTRHHERRACHRYPLELEVRFTFTSKGKVLLEGTGTTRDISIHGIALKLRVNVPIDVVAELNVTWPVLLDDRDPLSLRVVGRVVRHDSSTTAIAIVRHAFCTPSSEFVAQSTPELKDV